MRRGIQLASVMCLMISVAACGGSAASSTGATTAGSATSAGSAAAALSTAQPPWPLPVDARPYIAAAGLTVRGSETLNVHYHAHLDIVDRRQVIAVPAGIGFVIQNGQATGITSRHTHDASGVIHVESQTNAPYSLGQVFTEWGVRLTTGQIGGLMSGNGNVLRAYVNGAPVTGDPASIVLRPHQEIALWFGPASATPQIARSYSFPAGE